MSLGSIIVRLSCNTADFETDTKRAAAMARKRAGEIDQAFTKAGKAIGLALGAVVAGATVALKNAIDRADELSKAAQKIGVTTEALSTLAYAAQLAGVDLDQLQAGLGRLTKFQDAAAQGTQLNIDTFKQLGIEFENTNGTLRDTGDVFRDFATRFGEMEDGPEKAAIALRVFGRSGADLIPLLNAGAEGLGEMEDRARRLGLELSTGTGKKAEELNDRFSDLGSMVQGLAWTVAEELLPDIIDLTDALAKTIREGGGMVEVGRDIADIFRGLAKVFKAADLAVEGLGERFQITSNYHKMLFDPMGWRTYQADIDKSTANLRELEAESERLALSARQDFGMDPKIMPIEDGSFTGRPRRERGGTAMRDGESVVITPAASQLATWGTGSGSGGGVDRAARDAAREAEAASRMLQEQIERAEAAQADFLRTTEDLRAEIGGPLAQVTLEYVRREDELIELAKLAGLTNEELAGSLDLLEAARLRDVDAIMKQAEAEANRAQELADAPLIGQMDALRDTAAGFFADLVMNGEDAIDRLQQYLLTNALESIGKQIAEGLFGDFGTTGSGSKGSGFAAIFGSLFGGARAGGGPVYGGKAYLVGERGPELVIPKSAGTVVPSGRTAAMLGGQRSGGNTSIVIQGATSPRSLDRLAIQQGRLQRRSTSEFA